MRELASRYMTMIGRSGNVKMANLATGLAPDVACHVKLDGALETALQT